MRLFRVFIKSMKEQLRSCWMLILTLCIAPVFVLLYWVITGGGSTSYRVLIINRDTPSDVSISDQVIENMRSLAYADGRPLLKITLTGDQTTAESKLKDRQAAALLIFPVDFSERLYAFQVDPSAPPAELTITGDLTNPYYPLVSIMALSAVDDYVKKDLGQTSPVIFNEIPLGDSNARTEFEMYVPSLLILAVVMLIFQVSMTVAREVESNSIKRLQMTNITAFDLLGGISLTLVLIGVSSVILTFLIATLLGFHSQGPLWVAILLGALTSFSIVGVGLMVACLAKTVSEAFIYSNFPLIFLMFFTGAVFPMPPVPIFSVAGRTIGLFDFMPPTHAIVALNKVLTLGAGLKEITYELCALTLLSALYFGLGIWLFHKFRLKRS